MTEAEWLSSTDPQKMLAFLGSKASKRKLMLFASACCHRVWDLLPRKESRDMVAMLDLYADDHADCEDLQAAALPADEVRRRIKHPAKEYAALAASNLRLIVTMTDISWAVGTVANHARTARRPGVEVECRAQSELVRCIFGNPSRPVVAESCWRTSTVVSLAQAIYEERAFDRLPILADALEEAGCHDNQLLGHCRGPGPHARGCFVVDLLLEKE